MAKSNTQSTLTIRILGRDYPVSCPDSEREALLSSAEQLAERMRAIQNKSKTLSMDRIAVLAALNTTRDLLNLQQELDQLKAETRSGLNSNGQQDLTERLVQLQARIDEKLD